MKETSARIILYAKNSGEVLMSKGDTGSVKFLGGKINTIDKSPLGTAIREAREEGGIDLSKYESSIVELPFQDNDPQRPSYWFGVATPRLTEHELIPGGDVLALFWVLLELVEEKLTHDNWKEHWGTKLLPALLVELT